MTYRKTFSEDIITDIILMIQRQTSSARHMTIIAMIIAFMAFYSVRSTASNMKSKSYSTSDYRSLTKLLNDLNLDNKLPPHQINLIKGDISFSRGNYFEAQKYYKRSINDKAIRDSLNLLLQLEFKLMLCFDRMEDFSLIAHSLDDFSATAHRLANPECLAAIPYLKGKVAYYSGEKEKGFKLMKQAIERMKKTDESMSYDYLMYFYNNLVKLLQRNRMGNEALATLKEMKNIMRKPRQQSSMSLAFSDDTWMKEFYGLYAITLQRMGYTEEATSYYNKFLSLTHVQIYDYSCIESYLFEKKLYDDVIRFGQLRLNYLSSMNDTLNSSIGGVYRLLAKAYAQKGMYEEALRSFELMDEASEEQKRMGELSAMDELSANYSTYIDELEKQRKEHDDRMLNLFIIIGFIALMIVLSISRTIRHNRIIKQKNRLLVKTINELRETKEKAKRQKEEQKNDDILDDTAGENYPENPSLSPGNDNGETIAEYHERRMFERMNRDLIEKKLYLDPALSRTMLLDKYNIPRNNFSSLFQKYVGTSYSKYINNLRLEQAAKMLKEQPNYTIESIANDCGIASVATLYRLFSKKYGMTPTEYRQVALLPEDSEEDNDDTEN